MIHAVPNRHYMLCDHYLLRIHFSLRYQPCVKLLNHSLKWIINIRDLGVETDRFWGFWIIVDNGDLRRTLPPNDMPRRKTNLSWFNIGWRGFGNHGGCGWSGAWSYTQFFKVIPEIRCLRSRMSLRGTDSRNPMPSTGMIRSRSSYISRNRFIRISSTFLRESMTDKT